MQMQKRLPCGKSHSGFHISSASVLVALLHYDATRLCGGSAVQVREVAYDNSNSVVFVFIEWLSTCPVVPSSNNPRDWSVPP